MRDFHHVHLVYTSITMVTCCDLILLSVYLGSIFLVFQHIKGNLLLVCIIHSAMILIEN